MNNLLVDLRWMLAGSCVYLIGAAALGHNPSTGFTFGILMAYLSAEYRSRRP